MEMFVLLHNGLKKITQFLMMITLSIVLSDGISYIIGKSKSSIIERKPLAPVFWAIAFLAISSFASSVITSSAPLNSSIFFCICIFINVCSLTESLWNFNSYLQNSVNKLQGFERYHRKTLHLRNLETDRFQSTSIN